MKEFNDAKNNGVRTENQPSSKLFKKNTVRGADTTLDELFHRELSSTTTCLMQRIGVKW